ncbi:hypothetical protein [Leifsonia poae]|uniref:Uncharacterized protein n=1 Tax=Leifsonia poae TaxID=110933 RepID=A0A9W6HBC3_9MICO|nr:hypothetical protein [Leifsonia poae]GLJ77167.1 hypothetical protein GCM10017584_27410 [Leifsonia poae]
MPVLFIILIVLAIIFFGLGIFVTALKWLLYIAIILLLVGVIGWIIRSIRGRSNS